MGPNPCQLIVRSKEARKAHANRLPRLWSGVEELEAETFLLVPLEEELSLCNELR